MLHRGLDWLWLVVEGEENMDYTQIKTANRRVTFLMYIRLSAFAKHGFPFISNRNSILFCSDCAGISTALLDRTVSWPWNFRETSTRAVGQSCSSFTNGSFLCFARAFDLVQVLQSLFGYEPYPGFQMRVNAKIKAEIKEWQDKKQKKVS
ncbi:hypothetical protein Golax_012813 [Gossypium laxum]|uniref:Uncharacterized protein n=1 Tax=Gossypium laxum TaxID=34288 RepID=A0A7J8ZPQ7_9ROSI|nr:hypothetical protein [Gossypium laxum]